MVLPGGYSVKKENDCSLYAEVDEQGGFVWYAKEHDCQRVLYAGVGFMIGLIIAQIAMVIM
jgi:hypothetical protein